MFKPILQTKLYVPDSHTGDGRTSHIHRQRLLDKLSGGLTTRLTTICAPAGFGKSTLLSEWVRQGTKDGVKATGRTAAPIWVAWLSLDDGDNDPIHFWTYVVAALQTVNVEIGVATSALLQSPQPLPAEILLTPLLNDLAIRQGHLVLVLDDYHVINTTDIHKGLLFLLNHLPPQMHIVVSSRSDPPWPQARWRGQNQLTELRSEDLRFTPEEAALFLNDVMGLALSVQEIQALETRTEGWIAGLQLVGLSLQGSKDVEGFISAFSGSNRYIMDYLVEEVLHRQPEAIQSFLLQTSILDRLCGSLCDAVINAPEQNNDTSLNGQAILEYLERANLFLIPLDVDRTWYRYHHLFAEVLRNRFHLSRPAALPHLHMRASLWHEKHEDHDAAVAHALAVPNVERAAQLVERVALAILLRRGEILQARRLLEQLPIAMLHTRPHLILAYGIMLLLFGRLDAVEQLMRDAAPAISMPDLPAEIVGGLTVMAATYERFHGNLDRALELSQLALTQLPAEARRLRTASLMTIGIIHIRQNRHITGQHILTEAIELGVASEAEYLTLASMEEIASDRVTQGLLTQAKQTAEAAIALAAHWGWTLMPASGLAEIVVGEVLCEWNDLDAAIQVLRHGMPLLRGTTETRLLARGDIALARALWAQGDTDAALLTYQQGDEWFTQTRIVANDARAWLAAYQARLALRQSDLALALRWAETVEVGGEATTIFVQQFTLVRLRIAQYRSDQRHQFLTETMHLLTELVAAAEPAGLMNHVIEGCMLQALVCHVQGQHPAAQSMITRALTLAEPEGYVRLFVDEGAHMQKLLRDVRLDLVRRGAEQQPPRIRAYINRLLAALDAEHPAHLISTSPKPPPAYPLVEPLTERELEVLRLVNDGLSNSEMAARLIVSVGTVKKHLNNIFGKLGVSSRTQALVSARALHLL